MNINSPLNLQWINKPLPNPLDVPLNTVALAWVIDFKGKFMRVDQCWTREDSLNPRYWSLSCGKLLPEETTWHVILIYGDQIKKRYIKFIKKCWPHPEGSIYEIVGEDKDCYLFSNCMCKSTFSIKKSKNLVIEIDIETF